MNKDEINLLFVFKDFNIMIKVRIYIILEIIAKYWVLSMVFLNSLQIVVIITI